jgi:membrane fusion protein, multidrug efflux system
MRNQTLTLIISSLLLIVINLSCSTKAESSKKQKHSPAPAALPIDAVIAKETSLESSEKLAGSIIANRSVDIMSELSRKVVSVHFKDGNVVNEGQVLFELDDADLRAKQRQVAAELNLAKLTEARLKKLLASETVREEEYDVALAKLDALKAANEIVLTELSKTIIRAPFSGLVGISKVHEGTLVSPGLTLVNLQEQRRLKLMFSVAEKYLSITKVGRKILFTTAVDDQIFTATISSTEASLDQQSRNITVHAVVENSSSMLRPGMSVVVHFSPTVENASGIMIPTEALMAGEKGYSVFLVKNGSAAITPVEIANRTELSALVVSGIKSGDTVMTSNLLRAANGTPVSIVSLQN